MTSGRDQPYPSFDLGAMIKPRVGASNDVFPIQLAGQPSMLANVSKAV